jgi:hypothetical protein
VELISKNSKFVGWGMLTEFLHCLHFPVQGPNLDQINFKNIQTGPRKAPAKPAQVNPGKNTHFLPGTSNWFVGWRSWFICHFYVYAGQKEKKKHPLNFSLLSIFCISKSNNCFFWLLNAFFSLFLRHFVEKGVDYMYYFLSPKALLILETQHKFFLVLFCAL